MREQYHRQIEELLTNYAKLDVLWFDGGEQDWLNFCGEWFMLAGGDVRRAGSTKAGSVGSTTKSTSCSAAGSLRFSLTTAPTCPKTSTHAKATPRSVISTTSTLGNHRLERVRGRIQLQSDDGPGKYGGREQLRMPLIFRVSLCKRSSDR